LIKRLLSHDDIDLDRNLNFLLFLR
jgi:hypothetical protein